MYQQRIVTVCFMLLFIIQISAQKEPTWDNTVKVNWDNPFEEISIPSSADGSKQKAFIYKSNSKTPQPLIVSLHTWSGNYTQKDPLAKEILERNWNYIHPDFRGANRRPEALGSSLVISDIEDAIRFALEYTNANSREVHIIGVSGGGYATLLSYMNVVYPVKSFSAWVPISDVEDWYWESIGRGQKYTTDILNAIPMKDNMFDSKEAALRSPIKQYFPIERRKEANLFIYAGVHDGYKGSVPITHSIHMYNRLVGELKYEVMDLNVITLKATSDPDLVSSDEIITLLTKRMNPLECQKEKLYDRDIHLFRKYENIQLIIFEGSHEQISQALELVPFEVFSSHL